MAGDSVISSDPCCGCESAGGLLCKAPRKLGDWYVAKTNLFCSPQTELCSVSLRVPLEFPGNKQNTGITPQVFWFQGSSAPDPCNPIFPPYCDFYRVCGFPGDEILEDFGETSLHLGDYNCSTIVTASADYSLIAWNECLTTCRRSLYVNGMHFGGPATALAIGCSIPPPDDCATNTNECRDCRPAGGGCSVSADGNLSCTFPASGAHLRYRAGGAGGASFPGTAGTLPWTERLGLYFSHDYAQRIVIDNATEGISHVWLITEGASFREFKNPAAGSGLRLYDVNLTGPSDEYRRLYYCDNASPCGDVQANGWSLDSLDGRRDVFRPDGQWEKTVYAADTAVPPHPKVATYDVSNHLTEVAFPDGRKEIFEYHASGKLFKLKEAGVGVADCATAPPGDCREWTYTWAGNELTTITRPDGTQLELSYDPAKPGYLTQVLLKAGTFGRVQAAFAWNSSNRLYRAWRGDPSFTGSNAVDKQEFSYTNPALPTGTVVTEWVQDSPSPVTFTTTYELDRDSPRSIKAKILSQSGACAACGLTPDTTFEYTHAAHPLRASAMIDAKLNRTEYEYTDEGRMESKREAVGSAVERTTTYEYGEANPSLKGLLTAIQMPSTTTGLRRTEMNYNDATGALETRTIKGNEVGGPSNFTPSGGLVTTFTNTVNGVVGTIDPPDPGGSDVTTFTYDEVNVPGRNGRLPDSRIDPVLGPTKPTKFRYDALNRRTKVIDPNNVETETKYDEMGRVEEIRQKGEFPTDDLVTRYLYDCPSGPPVPEPQPGDPGYPAACHDFRDLRCVELPRGNAIEYRYDAMGRLVAVTRKANCLDTTQPLERTLYTLDKLGNRTLEQLQRWIGSAWTPDSATEYVYSSRCHVDKIVRGKGEAYESTTEYCYDKNNNLEKVWDANHPSASFPLGHTRYEYDARDRLIRVTQPWGPNAASCDPIDGNDADCSTTRYEYDVQDHLEKVTDAEKNETTYETSDRDLLTKETSAVFSGAAQSGCGTLNCRQMTYNTHGQLATEKDPRGITVARSHDDLDRLTSIDFPTENALDTAYLYDVSASEFEIGRLSSISRNGGLDVVSYAYDRFGRMKQDGDLEYRYDKNGNRTEVRYPTGLAACYTFETFADRETTLSWSTTGGATPCASGTTPIVNTAAYYASGPLRTLALANGITESRDYDKRYFPDRIAAGSLFDWDYQYTNGGSTDRVGNVLKIDELNGAATDRIYTYQDHQYFLTAGNGPWGNQSWTYNRIGNRLSETDSTSPVSAAYTYFTSPFGNTPRLASFSPPPNRAAGTRSFTYDAAGNQTTIDDSGGELFGTDTFAYSEESKLKKLSSNYAPAESTILYDGRGFLRQAELVYTTPGSTEVERAEPTYSSTGLLFRRRSFKQRTPHDPETGMSLIVPPIDKAAYIFYFAGRPVAQWNTFVDGAPGFLYLTTDHLGTPIIATDTAGTQTWPSWKSPNAPTAGGLKPFGGMFAFAEGTEMFLRFPGQWEDGAWKTSARIAGDYYNVHRWYETAPGRYNAADPWSTGIRAAREGMWAGGSRAAARAAIRRILSEPVTDGAFTYSKGNPLRYYDPLGLQVGGVCQAPPLVAPPPAWALLVVVAIVVTAPFWDDIPCEDCARPKESDPCEIEAGWCLDHPWQPENNVGTFGPRKDCASCYGECKKAGGAWPFYKCPRGSRSWDA